MKTLSVEMAYLLSIENKIQAVWKVLTFCQINFCQSRKKEYWLNKTFIIGQSVATANVIVK